MTVVGNVCPARMPMPESGRFPRALPHEPAEDIEPVLSPFMRPVRMLACRHCGGLYVELLDPARSDAGE